MISILLSSFLSFSVLTGPSLRTNSADALHASQPTVNVQTGEYEVGWWMVGLHGRHQKVKIGEPQYLGILEIAQLSDNFDGNLLTDLHFEQTISTIEENSVSTTISASSSVISTIAVKAGLSQFSVSGDYAVQQSFKIEQTATYTISSETEYSVSYNIESEKVKGKIFHLASAAFTYKIECEMWEWDDYWWGAYEVYGSRKSFVTYLTLYPYLTLAEFDGTLIK